MTFLKLVDRKPCERNLAFIWLTQGQKPGRDAFYEFKGSRLTPEILEDLHYQFLRRLKKEGIVTLKELFVDGTKPEATANRCTFVWRKHQLPSGRVAGYHRCPLSEIQPVERIR